MVKCSICGKKVKIGGLGGHKRLAHTIEGTAQIQRANQARRNSKISPWNKGLSKETDSRVKAYSISKIGKTFITDKGRKSLSIIAKKRKLGGYNPKGGRGKKGWYKNYWCDSSWELAWILYHLDHNIKFERNTKKFEYFHEGVQKFYIPDFILSSGVYVEIKGYFSNIVKSKLDAFPHSIEIFDKIKMQYILKYVQDKYGKHFTYLYGE